MSLCNIGAHRCQVSRSKIFSFFVLRIITIGLPPPPFEPRRILEHFVVLAKALCEGRVVASSPRSFNDPVAHDIGVLSENPSEILATLSSALHAQGRHQAFQLCRLPILAPAGKSLHVGIEQAADLREVALCGQAFSYPARAPTQFVDILLAGFRLELAIAPLE